MLKLVTGITAAAIGVVTAFATQILIGRALILTLRYYQIPEHIVELVVWGVICTILAQVAVGISRLVIGTYK